MSNRQNDRTQQDREPRYQRNNNSAMKDKFERIRPNIKTRHEFNDPYQSVMKWKEDGIDHINISPTGNTSLGQILSHASPIQFKHKVFGQFGSMESFWHYIQSEEQDDRIRYMSGQTLSHFSRKLTRKIVTNFRAIIMDSNYQRIIQNEFIVKELKESTLPFDCYYIERATGMRRRLNYFHWMLIGMEEIRNAIKEDRQPNFDGLKDDKNSEIYQFVRPPENSVVTKEHSEVKKTKPYSLIQQYIKPANRDNVPKKKNFKKGQQQQTEEKGLPVDGDDAYGKYNTPEDLTPQEIHQEMVGKVDDVPVTEQTSVAPLTPDAEGSVPETNYVCEETESGVPMTEETSEPVVSI